MANNPINYKYRQSCPDFEVEHLTTRKTRKDVKSLIIQFELIADKSLGSDIWKKNSNYKCNLVLETGAMSRGHKTKLSESDSDFVKKNAITNKLSDGKNNESTTVSEHSRSKTSKSKLPPPSKPSKDDKPKRNGIMGLFSRIKDSELSAKSVSKENSMKYKSLPRDMTSTSLKEKEMKKSTSSSQLRAGSPSYVRDTIKCFENQNTESVDVVLRKNAVTSNGVVNKSNDSLFYRTRTNSYISAMQPELDLSKMKMHSDEVKILENTTVENKTSLLESERSPVDKHRKFKLYPPPSPKLEHFKLNKPLPSMAKIKQEAAPSHYGLEQLKPVSDVRRRSSYVSQAILKFEKDNQNPVMAVIDLQLPINQEFKNNANKTLLNKLAAGPLEKESRKKINLEINDTLLEKLSHIQKQLDGECQVKDQDNNNLHSKIAEDNCENDENNVLTVINQNNDETSLKYEVDAKSQKVVLYEHAKKLDNVGQPFPQNAECQEQKINTEFIFQGTNSIEQDQGKTGLTEDDCDEENVITIVYHHTELATNSAVENDNHANRYDHYSLQSESSLEIEDVGMYNNEENNKELGGEYDVHINIVEDSRFEKHEIKLKASITAETECSKPDYLIIMRDSTTINSNESCVKCKAENETQNKTEIPQKQADSETINNNVDHLKVSLDKSEWSLDKLSTSSMQINEWSSDSNEDMTHNHVLNEECNCCSAQTGEIANSESVSIQDQSCECSGEYTVPMFDSQQSVEEIQSAVDDLFAHVENLRQTNPVKSQRVSRLYSGKFGRASSTPSDSPKEDNNNNDTKIGKNEFEKKEMDRILLENIERLPDKDDDEEGNDELSPAEKFLHGYCAEVKNDPYTVEAHNSSVSKECYTNEWIRNISQEFVVNGPESIPDVANDNDSVFSGVSVVSEDQEYQNVEYSFNATGQQSWTYRDDQNNPMCVVQSTVNPYPNENLQLRKNAASATIGKKIEESENEYSSRRSAEALKNSSRRLGLMDEIISTERRYVEGSLRLLVEEYLPEMDRSDLPRALVGRINHIFGNVKILYQYHKQFLPELEACKDTDQIANCFIKHETLFKYYPLYARNKPLSDSVMKHHASYFTRKQKQLRDPLDLASYLLNPIQRLGKYCLLMKSLARECEKENIKNEQVKKALDMLQKLMSLGNNLIVMDSITGCEVSLREQGELLLSDPFHITPPGKKSPFEGMVFLFQEALIITSIQRHSASETFEFREFFQLTDMGYTNNESENLSFQIWFRKRDQNSFTLKAKKPSVKDTWTKEIHSLLWKQFEANKRRKKREQEQSGVIQTPILTRPISIPLPKRKKSSPKASKTRYGSVWYSGSD